MVKAFTPLPTATTMTVAGRRTKSTAKVSLCGQMATNLRVSTTQIKSTAQVNTPMPTVTSLRDNTTKIKSMDKELLPLLMASIMKAGGQTIRSMATGSKASPLVETPMREAGRPESFLEREDTHLLMVKNMRDLIKAVKCTGKEL